MQEKANEIELCECCKENEAQYELKSTIEDVTYKVCGNCLQPLVCYQLEPEQFKNLLSSGHSDEEFLIHGDFYDDDGIMQQPECGIDLRIAKMMLEDGYLNDVEVPDEWRSNKISDKEHILVCPTCGLKGKIRNVVDKDGKFVRCEFTKGIAAISKDHHTLPICKKCNTAMEDMYE